MFKFVQILRISGLFKTNWNMNEILNIFGNIDSIRKTD